MNYTPADEKSPNINPANDAKVSELPPNYIPMSAPIRRLQVPEKAGYHRHWFRGDAGRIQRAQQAGYRFVDQREVRVNNFDVGGNAEDSGSTDLGSRVSVVTGDDASIDGQPNRLYLMELPLEHYERAQKYLEELNESVAQELRSGLIGSDSESASDRSKRYSKTGVPDLFNPHKRRR